MIQPKNIKLKKNIVAVPVRLPMGVVFFFKQNIPDLTLGYLVNVAFVSSLLDQLPHYASVSTANCR